MINMKLAKQRNLSQEKIDMINAIHDDRDEIHINLQNGTLQPDKNVGELLSSFEEKLQKLWGFDVNSNYYKYWWVPKCTCPKLDNDDAYPTGFYTINMACPLHGKTFV